MGRPRKVVKEGNFVQQGDSSNPSAVPVIDEENAHSQTDINSTVKETTDVETKVDNKSDVSQTVMVTSSDSIRLTRQSGRLKRKPETYAPFNLVGCNEKEPKLLANKLPTPDEIISEQELPLKCNSDLNMETVNVETTVHLDSNGSQLRKKTSEATAPSARIKKKKEPVERKKKPSKRKLVSFAPCPTEKNSEQEEPSQVNQSVDERNLVEKVEYVAQGNTSPNDDTPIDTDYRMLFLDAQKRIEDLMEDNIDLVKELKFAHGKIEAYEKMMGTMGFALQLSSQRSIPTSTHAAAPDTSNNHKNVSAPKASSPTKRGKYSKKANA